MNITEADRLNQQSVIEAFLDNETAFSGVLHRAQSRPDDHPFDYWLQYYSTATKEWMTYGFVEIKCRSKRYNTLKISQSKMIKLFEISQRYGIPFFLLVWFNGENVVHILDVKHLSFPESIVVNKVNGRLEEPGFEIPIANFTRRAPIDAEFQHSANSDPIPV